MYNFRYLSIAKLSFVPNKDPKKNYFFIFVPALVLITHRILENPVFLEQKPFLKNHCIPAMDSNGFSPDLADAKNLLRTAS